MGRIGISQEEVEAAAHQLQGRGKQPTVDNIREILGTGSKSTILQHLKTLKSKQQTSQGKLPPELLSLVTGLWERLNGLTDQRLIENQSKSDGIIVELCETIHHLQNDLQTLQSSFKSTTLELNEEKASRALTEERLLLEKQALEGAKQKISISEQFIEDQKEENKRLHQLASHIQTNLEHYQNAMQQARAEQLLQTEMLQNKFQQDLSQLQQELYITNMKLQEAEHKVVQFSLELQQEKSQHQALKDEFIQHRELLQSQTADLIIFKDRCEQYKEQSHQFQQTLEDKNHQLMAYQNQSVLQNYKIEQLEIRLEHILKENKELQQKSTELTQELYKKNRLKQETPA